MRKPGESRSLARSWNGDPCVAVAQRVFGCCFHTPLEEAIGTCVKVVAVRAHRHTSDSAEYLIKPTSETTFSPMMDRYYLIWKPSPTKSNKHGYGESCGNQGNTVLTSWTGVGMLRGSLMELNIYHLSATSPLPRHFIFFMLLGFSLSLSG